MAYLMVRPRYTQKRPGLILKPQFRQYANVVFLPDNPYTQINQAHRWNANIPRYASSSALADATFHAGYLDLGYWKTGTKTNYLTFGNDTALNLGEAEATAIMIGRRIGNQTDHMSGFFGTWGTTTNASFGMYFPFTDGTCYIDYRNASTFPAGHRFTSSTIDDGLSSKRSVISYSIATDDAVTAPKQKILMRDGIVYHQSTATAAGRVNSGLGFGIGRQRTNTQISDWQIEAFLVFNRAFPFEELVEAQGNPYLYLFDVDVHRRIFIPGGATSITGTAAPSEGSDTLAATGTAFTAITGTLVATEGADTLSATGTASAGVTGTLAATEGADTLAATGVAYTAITGTTAATEGTDTLNATGSVAAGVVGSVAATEGADTLAATGTAYTVVTGTGALTEGADTLSASGVALTAITGTGASTESADTLQASGTVIGAGAITGTATPTEGADALGTYAFVYVQDLDPQSEAIMRTINKSFLSEDITHKTLVDLGFGDPFLLTISTFKGLFLHSRADSYPVVYAARDDAKVTVVKRGDRISVTDIDDNFIVEGIRSDGGFILTLELRNHIA